MKCNLIGNSRKHPKRSTRKRNSQNRVHICVLNWNTKESIRRNVHKSPVKNMDQSHDVQQTWDWLVVTLKASRAPQAEGINAIESKKTENQRTCNQKCYTCAKYDYPHSSRNGRCPKIDLSGNGSRIKHIIDTGTNLNILIPRQKSWARSFKIMQVGLSCKNLARILGFFLNNLGTYRSCIILCKILVRIL